MSSTTAADVKYRKARMQVEEIIEKEQSLEKVEEKIEGLDLSSDEQQALMIWAWAKIEQRRKRIVY